MIQRQLVGQHPIKDKQVFWILFISWWDFLSECGSAVHTQLFEGSESESNLYEPPTPRISMGWHPDNEYRLRRCEYANGWQDAPGKTAIRQMPSLKKCLARYPSGVIGVVLEDRWVTKEFGMPRSASETLSNVKYEISPKC